MQAQVTTPMPADATVPLPMRAHTILGVCEAIGEDFGFNPNWLRIPLASTVIFSPLLTFSAYFALGAVVLVSRMVAPAKVAANDRVVDSTAVTAANCDAEQKLAA